MSEKSCFWVFQGPRDSRLLSNPVLVPTMEFAEVHPWLQVVVRSPEEHHCGSSLVLPRALRLVPLDWRPTIHSPRLVARTGRPTSRFGADSPSGPRCDSYWRPLVVVSRPAVRRCGSPRSRRRSSRSLRCPACLALGRQSEHPWDDVTNCPLGLPSAKVNDCVSYCSLDTGPFLVVQVPHTPLGD